MAEKQTMRQRLKADRRRKRLRALRNIICVGLLIWGCKAAWDYVHQPGLAVGDIVVHGTSQLTKEDVTRMGGCEPPFNIFNFSMGRLRDGLNQDIRFRTNSVNYHFPASVDVYVNEREPALYVANSYRSYLQVDYDGVVIKVTSTIPDAKAPVLVGAQSGNVFLGDKVDNRYVLNVLEFLKHMDQDMRDRISEIAIDGYHVVTIKQRNRFPFILGPAEDLPNKVELFKTVYKEVKDKTIQAEYIDLTYAKPYIKLIPEEK